jgi:hypothetical protein
LRANSSSPILAPFQGAGFFPSFPGVSLLIRTRPLFPYPQIATYKGSGSTDEEKNFRSKDGN